VALQTELLGANQHESYWIFDICYNNASAIVPTTITGDMHSINKANFAILHWFGMNLAPRFTNLQAQMKHLLRDPQLQRNVHRSENRIESYHQLRSTIAQVNGKKELTGRTDLDVAISNHCGRLIANVVIAYNSMLLSGLLGRYLATGNVKVLDLLRRISPAAWQHLHFLGHYAFRNKRHPIDLEAILKGVDWEQLHI
jgi:hypothetical protein